MKLAHLDIAMPRLMEMFRTDDVPKQILAAQRLGQLGLEAKAALPAIDLSTTPC
jgi:hypothetical protein